jgi:hypothetical protein
MSINDGLTRFLDMSSVLTGLTDKSSLTFHSLSALLIGVAILDKNPFSRLASVFRSLNADSIRERV